MYHITEIFINGEFLMNFSFLLLLCNKIFLNNDQDHLLSRMEKKTEGKADLVVFCYDGTESMNQLDQPRPESMLSSFK